MASIHGRYEYDDDLTPGKKREGGLHQNLYDKDRNLAGSARFLPDDDSPSDPAPWPTDPDARGVDDDAPRLTQEERDQLEALVERVVLPLLAAAGLYGAPHARRLWREKARPAVQARLKQLNRRRRRRRRLRRRSDSDVSTALEGTVVEAMQAQGAAEPKVDMTASEAEARRLLAMALRQASDEQLRVLANASIVADNQPAEDSRQLQALPKREARPLPQGPSTRPALTTGDEVLSALQYLLGTGHLDSVPHPLKDLPRASGPSAEAGN